MRNLRRKIWENDESRVENVGCPEVRNIVARDNALIAYEVNDMETCLCLIERSWEEK